MIRHVRFGRVCSAAMAIFVVPMVWAQELSKFDLPPQSLAASLRAVGSQASVNVLFDPPLVEGLQAPALKAKLTSEQAFSALLAGSGLRVRFLDSKTVMVISASASKSAAEISLTGLDPQTVNSESGDDALRVAQTADTQDVQNNPSSPPSSSKDEPGRSAIQEVIVTAQKREERIQDVPMSITAKSGEELLKAGISNMQDLSFAVPGLTVSELGGGKQFVAVRGIFNVSGTSMLTGLYLDELPISALQTGDSQFGGGADLRTLDLERVEVLKGPQGTLFGEGAAGGVIRFITRDPDTSRSGGELSSRLYNTTDGGWSQEIVGIVNVPLVEDVFGVRIASTYENKAGWIDNPASGREDINDNEVKHVRVKALLNPTAELQIKGSLETHRNAGGGSNLVNQLPYSRSAFIPAVHPTAPTPYTDNYDLYNLTVTYDLGFADLLSSSSHARMRNRRVFAYQSVPEDPGYFQVFIPGESVEQTVTNQELRLTSAAEGRFRWTIGAAYKDAELVASDGVAGFDAILDGTELPGLGANIYTTNQSESWAGFADASYQLSEKFEIGGGLRYFNDERRNFDAAQPAVVPLSANFDKLTWRIVAKYKPSENANLYANVGTGFRSGIHNSAVAVAAGFPEGAGPEVITSYEVGAKMSMPDWRLNLNVAGFYSNYDGLQATIAVLSPGSASDLFFVNSNAQFAVIKGFEAELTWAASDRMTLSMAGERVFSEITRLLPSLSGTPYAVGDDVNLIPEYRLSTTADYRFNWGNSTPGFFLLTLNRQGKSRYVTRNSTLTLPYHWEQTAREKTFLDANIGGEWNGWELGLFGRNLLDEREILAPYTGGIWTPQARPRTFGVEFRKSFW